MDAAARIERVAALPAGLDRLVEASRAEGFEFVARLRDEWLSGANRFDLAGEALYVARAATTHRGDALVGIAGLNRDPYPDAASSVGLGRVRHVYVHPESRRSGVGSLLVAAVVSHAAAGFRVLRLRTNTPAGDRFYRALGFTAAPEELHASHRLILH